MKSIVQLLLLSVPHTREGHGSKCSVVCSNPKCELNGGSEKHTYLIGERLSQIHFSNSYKRRKRVLKYV